MDGTDGSLVTSTATVNMSSSDAESDPDSGWGEESRSTKKESKWRDRLRKRGG